MKTKFIVFVAILSSICIIFLQIYKDIGTINYKYNISSNTVLRKEYLPNNYSFDKLSSGGKQDFTFVSTQNNLGIIEFLFNNFSRVNSDVLIFRIKKGNTNSWYYQNYYDTSLMNIGQFFPFGFPIIKNSKGNTYQIEIESIKGNINDSVALSKTTSFFLSDYSYSLDYLKHNLSSVPNFIISKVTMYLSLLGVNEYLKYVTLAILTFISVFVILKIVIFKYLHNLQKTKWKFSRIFRHNKFVCFILIFYLITHLQFLNYTQYWDGRWYWELLLDAVYNFKFILTNPLTTIKSFSYNFNFLGHPSMGYGGLLAISQYIAKGSVYSLNFENMLFAVAAIFAFYKIVSYLFPSHNVENILITLVFAFNPLFYAASISLNTDFPVLVFDVLAICAFLYKNKYWFVFWSFMLIFSKETGFLIYSSFVASYFFIYDLKRLLSGDIKFDYKKYFAFIIPIIGFVFYLFLNHWKLWSNNGPSNLFSSSVFVWNNNGQLNFGLNIINVESRLFQIFVMNFAWILSAIIFASIIKSLLFKKYVTNHINDKTKDFVLVITSTLITFVLFNIAFILNAFSRYVVPSVFFVVLISYYCLLKLSKNIGLRLLLLTTLSTLVFIQVFTSLDPSPRLLFGTDYIGHNISSPFFGYRDGQVYNSQFVFIDKLSHKIITELPDNNGVLLDTGGTYYFNNIYEIGTVEKLASVDKTKYRNITYIYIPWFANENKSLFEIEKYYKIEYYKTVETDGYYVKLYNLEAI